MTEENVVEQELAVTEATTTEAAVVEVVEVAEVAEAAPQPEDGAPVVELSDAQVTGLLEALLLASGEPLSFARIQEVTNLPKARVKEAAERLKQRYSAEDCGFDVAVVAEKLQLRTKAVFADQVRSLMAVKPRKLSQAALETLAVIAYQQPVVKSEVDKIRGVDVAPTIKTLLERKLIKIMGYQASVGQPALYGTTEDFLQVFGLSSLSALPAMRDLKAIAQEPGEAQGDDESDAAVVEAPEVPLPLEEAAVVEAQPAS
jgi:segregation and condensation protein B